MATCPFCHTNVGEASVCKGCGAYQVLKESKLLALLVIVASIAIGYVTGSAADSFNGGIIVAVIAMIVISFGLKFSKLIPKKYIWMRKF
jgi:hypothetical protein